MISINYYKKYNKYKSKYLEIKNNLIGSGENGIIEFRLKNGESETPIEINENFILSLTNSVKEQKSVLIIVKKDDSLEHRFSIQKNLGKGGNGIVFLLNNNKVLKLPLNYKKSIKKEGQDEQFRIPDRSRALFQGDSNISFVIYNYLGKDLMDILHVNSLKEDNLALLFKLYKQLFNQIYELNINNQFHNDVKIENCVIFEDNLSLIDFGTLKDFSFLGTYHSVSMKGCVIFLKKNFSKDLQDIKLDDYIIEYLLENCINTDIIGFFYFIIDCLLINYRISKTSYSLLTNILQLKGNYCFTDIIKMLCFFSIISFNKKPYNILLTNPYCNYFIIEEIEKKLFTYSCDSPYIRLKDNNKGIYCYICFIFNELKFNNQDQFLFLLTLVKKCFNSTFNLEQFKENYDILLNKDLLLEQN